MVGASLEWSVRTLKPDRRMPCRGAACVIEPDDARRAQLSRRLARMGFVTHETAFGELGAVIAEQVSLRVIVVNVLVRDVQGLQLIRYLRDRAPAAVIVSVSERVRTSMPVMLSRLAGADAALIAPVSGEALAMAIEGVEPFQYGPPEAAPPSLGHMII